MLGKEIEKRKRLNLRPCAPVLGLGTALSIWRNHGSPGVRGIRPLGTWQPARGPVSGTLFSLLSIVSSARDSTSFDDVDHVRAWAADHPPFKRGRHTIDMADPPGKHEDSQLSRLRQNDPALTSLT